MRRARKGCSCRGRPFEAFERRILQASQDRPLTLCERQLLGWNAVHDVGVGDYGIHSVLSPEVVLVKRGELLRCSVCLTAIEDQRVILFRRQLWRSRGYFSRPSGMMKGCCIGKKMKKKVLP